ncbi:MAG: acyl carrier protein [Campylobacterales bacterium]|nr:acyl carrier protein [Campylobacterales bacterium]
MQSDIAKRVQEIIVEHFEKDLADITLDTLLEEDLELDSLDMFDLICALEAEYNFIFEREMGNSIKSVGDVVDKIKAHAPKA